jgi:hypothetical protein
MSIGIFFIGIILVVYIGYWSLFIIKRLVFIQ